MADLNATRRGRWLAATSLVIGCCSTAAHAQTAPEPVAGPVSAPDDFRLDGGSGAIGTGSLRLPRGDTLSGTATGDLVVRPTGGGRGVTVMTRPRPDFDPIGIPVGAFTLRPQLTAGIGYDGNVYTQPGGVDDIFGLLRGAADLRSNWNRHTVSVGGYVSERAYASKTSESGLTYRAQAQGTLDIDRTTGIDFEMSHEHDFLQRGGTTELITTERPVRFNVTDSGLTLRKQFGRLRTDVAAYTAYFNFENARTPAGNVFSQQFRDYKLYRGRVGIGYASGAGPVLFASATGDLRRYRILSGPIIRGSNGGEFLVGVSSDITPLIRGRLGFGYIFADFADRTIGTRGAAAFDANIDYLATELTTVHFVARRFFQNVALVNAPAGLTTEYSVGADHELLRNLIVSGSASYRTTDYVRLNTQSSGYGVDGGARLFINRRLRADASIGYRKRNNRQTLFGDYSEVVANVALTFGI